MSFNVERVAAIASRASSRFDAGLSREHRIALELAVFDERLDNAASVCTTAVLYNSSTKMCAEVKVSRQLRKLHRRVIATPSRDTFSPNLARDSKELAVLFFRSTACQHLSLWLFKGPSWKWVCHCSERGASRAVKVMLARTGNDPSLPDAVVGMHGGIRWVDVAFLSRLPLCFTCGKERVRTTCGSCSRQHYCSRECLRADRERHKPLCGRDPMITTLIHKAVPAEFVRFVHDNGHGGDEFCKSLAEV